MKENKRLLVEILKWVRLFIIIALLVGIGLFIFVKNKDSGKTEITSSFLNGKLETISNLTTSELTYTGLIKYSEGKIPILTQKSFSMIYTAHMRAGIDLSNAEIKVTEDKVIIKLPECEIQSIDVDESSIEFYDEHWAIFNWTEKTDIIDTVSAAKEDVKQKADITSLLQNARLQTEAIIKGLLVDVVDERVLIIQ